MPAAGAPLPSWGGARRGKRASQAHGKSSFSPPAMLKGSSSDAVTPVSSALCGCALAAATHACGRRRCITAGWMAHGMAPCADAEPEGVPAEQAAAAAKVLKGLMRHRAAAPFLQPVSEEAAPGYHAVIRRPMALGAVLQGLESRSYASLGELPAAGTRVASAVRLTA